MIVYDLFVWLVGSKFSFFSSSFSLYFNIPIRWNRLHANGHQLMQHLLVLVLLCRLMYLHQYEDCQYHQQSKIPNLMFLARAKSLHIANFHLRLPRHYQQKQLLTNSFEIIFQNSLFSIFMHRLEFKLK